MSEISKEVNKFFNDANNSDVDKLRAELLVTEHLNKVFEMKYIKGYDINFIAYETGYSRGKIEADLRKLRKKIYRFIKANT